MRDVEKIVRALAGITWLSADACYWVAWIAAWPILTAVPAVQRAWWGPPPKPIPAPRHPKPTEVRITPFGNQAYRRTARGGWERVREDE